MDSVENTSGVPHNVDDSDDIMLKILYKQPLESLARFKCVSKLWKRRIEEFCIPKILKAHEHVQLQVKSLRRRTMQHHVHYIDNRQVLYKNCSSMLQEDIFPRNLADCCNGLLLLRTMYNYVVCNPVTKQYALIPSDPQEWGIYDLINAALAFDPCISPHFRILSFQNPNHLLVFSSKSWKWKPLKLKFTYYSTTIKSVYFNQAIYKLYKELMVKFLIDDDDESDRVRIIKLPTTYNLEVKRCYGVSDGSLYYANVGYPDRTLEIWTLNGDIGDEQCEWMLKHRISCQTIGGDASLYSFHPCAFHPFSDNVIFLGCNGIGKYPNIYCYDFTKKTLEPHRKLFSIEEEEDFGEYLFYPLVYRINYFESLNRKSSPEPSFKS
ncbi:putative F-box protein At1g60370 [Ricinus communis]|uniref:F-box domain-containing protein n=1 Tax=Ricinus communis TaxID=3988 RepID=B9RWS6_RICCO|nr:putative F-box protein At1g60370 [Ricinus communis]EEF44328.1 conserved hypothetical protein [Ricinus communis]|eukprot:XP_002518195.1 putative F-box protein At1g60370 [Ricinus communis]